MSCACIETVSDDLSIIGAVKSGRESRGNYVAALSDCLFLNKIEAKKKLLVLTNKELYNYFHTFADGVIPDEIEVMLIQPEDLTSQVLQSTSESLWRG